MDDERFMKKLKDSLLRRTDETFMKEMGGRGSQKGLRTNDEQVKRPTLRTRTSRRPLPSAFANGGWSVR